MAARARVQFVGPEILCILTLLITATYSPIAIAGPPPLTPAEKKAVDCVTDGSENVPAWIIAQMLDASDRLGNFLDAKMAQPTTSIHQNTATVTGVPCVTVNAILAASAEYRARLCAIDASFGSVENVADDLDLPGDDHCWSVIIYDRKYRTAMQYFTTKRPRGFTKGLHVIGFGYYLGTRTERAASGGSSQLLTIPVFMGSVRAASTAGEGGGYFSNRAFFAVILFLIATYLSVRIYVGRSGRRRASFLNKER